VVKDVYMDNVQNKFKFFKLDDCTKPLYDSGDLKISYINKLAVFASGESVRFMFLNAYNRYLLNIPVGNETIVGKADDLLDKNIYDHYHSNKALGHSEYHGDLRESTITMNGKAVSVHYIQISNCHDAEKECFIGILEPQFKGAELRTAVSKIHMKTSAGSWHKGKYKEAMQLYSRSGSDEEAVFPAIVPKFMIQDIF